MANKTLQKVPVDKQKVMALIHHKGCSIRKLGDEKTGVGWSEKTIRRGLDSGFMTLDLITAIAKRIDVDTKDISEYIGMGVATTHKVFLTKEELEWLEVGRNLKSKTVREVIYDLELGGNDTKSAFEELHLIYSDDEDDQ